MAGGFFSVSPRIASCLCVPALNVKDLAAVGAVLRESKAFAFVQSLGQRLALLLAVLRRLAKARGFPLLFSDAFEAGKENVLLLVLVDLEAKAGWQGEQREGAVEITALLVRC